MVKTDHCMIGFFYKIKWSSNVKSYSFLLYFFFFILYNPFSVNHKIVFLQLQIYPKSLSFLLNTNALTLKLRALFYSFTYLFANNASICVLL